MVAGAFPLAKLAVLGLRQISKPIAVRLKTSAQQHAIFRQYFVIPLAQVYHRGETTMKMVMLGLGRPVKIEPLSEKMAVELGGDILSEFIVFAIASTLLVIEFRRQYASSVAKEAALHERLEKIEGLLDEARLTVEQHRAEISRLEHDIAYYTSPVARIKSLIPGKNSPPPPPPPSPSNVPSTSHSPTLSTPIVPPLVQQQQQKAADKTSNSSKPDVLLSTSPHPQPLITKAVDNQPAKVKRSDTIIDKSTAEVKDTNWALGVMLDVLDDLDDASTE